MLDQPRFALEFFSFRVAAVTRISLSLRHCTGGHVTAGDHRLVVVLPENRTDQTAIVSRPAKMPPASPGLLIQSLLRVVRPDLASDRLRKRGECQGVLEIPGTQ